MKKYILWVMISTLLVTSNISGCSNNKSNNAAIDDETAIAQDKKINYFMSGKVQADESAVIASKINARVSHINVDVGAAVNKGDYIITLDSKELEAQAQQAQAAVEVAQASLNKIKSGSRPEQIEEAEATVKSSEANYENSKANNERNKAVFDAGGISKSEFEKSETALIAAESTYKSAQAALDMLNKGETSESIAIAEAQVKSAQATLSAAQVQLENGAIAAPISGVVTVKNINDGELATAGTPLLLIVNLDTIIIKAYVPSTYINKICVNQAVKIKISEIPDKEFDGEISVIDSVVDSQNKDVLVKVAFKEKNSLLKPGMFAEIGIEE